MCMPVPPSATSGASGTLVNTKQLDSGSSAQMAASIFQLEAPKIFKNSVEITMTPALPQQ